MQTYIETNKHTYIHTDRQPASQPYIHTYRQTYIQAHIHTHKSIQGHTSKQAGIHTEADTHIDRRTYKQRPVIQYSLHACGAGLRF